MPPDEPSILCTICARGGSKGIPGKNIREVADKPLIAYSIEDALAWDRCEEVVVSTDSDEIADVAEDHGASVPFRRPDHLATDTAAKFPARTHALETMEDRRETTYDYLVDLDATAPLRTTDDIENCFRVVADTDARNGFTVTEADKNPYFNMVELDEDGYAHLSKDRGPDVVRRQDAPEVYEMNASIYVYEREYLLTSDSNLGDRTHVSLMPPKRSIDIDRPIDLAMVEFLIERWEGERD